MRWIVEVVTSSDINGGIAYIQRYHMEELSFWNWHKYRNNRYRLVEDRVFATVFTDLTEVSVALRKLYMKDKAKRLIEV